MEGSDPSNTQDVAEIAIHSCGLTATPLQGESAQLNQARAALPPMSAATYLTNFLDSVTGVRNSLAHLHRETVEWVDTYRNNSPDQWRELHTGLTAMFHVPADIAEHRYSNTVNKKLRVLLQLSVYIKFLKDQLISLSSFGHFGAPLGGLKAQLSQATCDMRGILAELTDEEITAYVIAHSSGHIVDLRRHSDEVKRRATYVAIDSMVTTFSALTISVDDGRVEINT